MEKRRRARMNECLDQLKHLLLHISPNHRTKLEKADILEMTVAYLNQMQHPLLPSTSFDNNAIYQQSYVEGFTVAASACLTYLQNTLPPSEFAPQAQQFRNGLIQHLQSVMSNHVNASSEDAIPIPSHSVMSCLPRNFQMRSLLTDNYLASNYLSNMPYPRLSCVPYQSNISGSYSTPVLHTVVSAASQSNIRSMSKDLIPRPVAVNGAQTALSGFCDNHPEKCSGHSKLAKDDATKDKINGLEKVETIKDVKRSERNSCYTSIAYKDKQHFYQKISCWPNIVGGELGFRGCLVNYYIIQEVCGYYFLVFDGWKLQFLLLMLKSGSFSFLTF
ncbi:unnamed protein product [Onchocerca ochengi]|uniref:BHLH domain-containing protein n=1 Tax=Onchocerca ochengi TaxID=42157 RepID=A0A182EGW1_ONCOC|nr:unnamed protein product [Onchocerca ochengi]